MIHDEMMNVNKILIKKIGLADSSPCFCGSTQYFRDCCKLKPNFWIPDKFTDGLIKYMQSKNWQVAKIPFINGKNGFESYYLKSLDSCARPQCNNKTVNSHVYGKKHVERYLTFNNCEIGNPYSSSSDLFVQVRTGTDLTYRIFCKDCENTFKEIDEPMQNVEGSSTVQFLHFLRTQAYQYQYSRWDLALAHQSILIKILLDIKRIRHGKNLNTTINLDWFISRNLNYQYQYSLRKKLWDSFHSNNGSISIFSHSRKLNTKNIIFSSGVINPSHDLIGDPIGFVSEASLFYYAVPADEKSMFIHVASLDPEYEQMIKQLSNLNDYKFLKYFNHLISMSSLPLNIILPDRFNVSDQIISKVKRKKEFILNNSPLNPSDIESRKILAKFL